MQNEKEAEETTMNNKNSWSRSDEFERIRKWRGLYQSKTLIPLIPISGLWPKHSLAMSANFYIFFFIFIFLFNSFLVCLALPRYSCFVLLILIPSCHSHSSLLPRDDVCIFFYSLFVFFCCCFFFDSYSLFLPIFKNDGKIKITRRDRKII